MKIKLIIILLFFTNITLAKSEQQSSHIKYNKLNKSGFELVKHVNGNVTYIIFTNSSIKYDFTMFKESNWQGIIINN